MNQPNIIERAFELARSGACANLREIEIQLKLERYSQVEEYLGGPGFRLQLRTIIKQAISPSAEGPTEAMAS
jgi:hypothetical protein